MLVGLKSFIGCQKENKIVNDRGFRNLMKTGWPEYHTPSQQTISQDVRHVFVGVCKRIAKVLQVSTVKYLFLNEIFKNSPCVGALSFEMDAWTSQNHKVYVVVTVHFESQGVPVSMLLDIVELACSHSGINLAAAFAKILEDFGISDKVSKIPEREHIVDSPDCARSSQSPAITHQTMTQ